MKEEWPNEGVVIRPGVVLGVIIYIFWVPCFWLTQHIYLVKISRAHIVIWPPHISHMTITPFFDDNQFRFLANRKLTNIELPSESSSIILWSNALE